jgi:hypothetical protein
MPLAPTRTLRTFRYAMYFDGVDDYISLFTTNFPDFTIVVWAKLSTPVWPSPVYRAIVSKGWPYDINGVGGIYVIGLNNYGGIFRDSAGNVVGAGSSNAPSLYESFRNIAVTSEFKFYVDGVLLSSYTRVNPLNTNTLPWNVGRDPIQGVRVFPGYIAQVLFYSRALSDSEVQWNYQYPGNPIKDGLVLWLWADPQYIKDVDGDGIPEWVDLSGYGNHGKIYGATLVQLVRPHKRLLAPARVLPPVR